MTFNVGFEVKLGKRKVDAVSMYVRHVLRITYAYNTSTSMHPCHEYKNSCYTFVSQTCPTKRYCFRESVS